MLEPGARLMWLLLVISAAVTLPGAATAERICKYHDVAEYLNVTERRELLSLTIPQTDWRRPLTITLDIVLIAILSVVEKSQTVITYSWVTVMWLNEFVRWDPQDFCNISCITLPLSHFWVPDMYIHEQVVEDTSPWMIYANVSSDGMMTASKPTRLTTTCALKIYYFPFDQQECNITVNSYMHLDNDIIMRPLRNSSEMRAESMHWLMGSGEWEFLDLTVYETHAGRRDQLIYTVTMKRRPAMYVLNLIIPTCALLILDTLSHFIPDSYKHKVDFKVTVLLGLSVLSLVLNDILPTSSDSTPLIALFFMGSLALLIISLFELILILYIEGILLKRSREMKPGGGDTWQALGDGECGLMERIRRDTQLVREQILALRSLQHEENECAALLQRLEKALFYIHLLAILTFTVTICVKWST
ncbi:5-hydroxytryptamine receptor 3A-like isoform X2 [Ascaphus truei]|uniref:5-hydroxytryptamine receptor 3A-like isoform X2 n=1 Tax=Ascaphus truei TaxID=8439 RepID=UPI003F5A4856